MGSFDGVHCGHRELLRRVMAQAEELNGESIVITFDPHPRYVLGTGEKMQLITYEPIHHGYVELGKRVGNAFADGKTLK